ncbi:MAG: hypothetical protein GXP41_11380, partial [Chloroflexi bacterium]|nr:hypothetical protein [Chloroflexota bacterium]
MSQKNAPVRRVLIIGLDGVTWDLIGPWVEAGELPNLRTLVDRGASGLLTTTVPPVSASAWASFATGTNPGKHGIVDFTAPVPNGYDIVVNSGAHRTGTPFWNLVGTQGKRVVVMGVPGTYPPQPVEGSLVCSFMSPGPDSNFTYPPELKQELERDIGPFPLAPREKHRGGPVLDFLADMTACLDRRAATAHYLLDREDWSLGIAVFASTDMLQHELWHLFDSTHPRHDPVAAEAYLPAVLGYFRRMDEHIGDLVQQAGPDAAVIIMSDHGFGPFHSFLHLNNWLRSLGLLRLKRSTPTALKSATFGLGFTPLNVLKALSRIGLGGLRGQVKGGKKGGLLRRLFLSFADVDWSRTQAFAVGNFGQVYINVAGERAEGIVRPGAEYEAVRDRIAEEALALRDPETGDRVVLRVYRREEIYTGPRTGELPDLILHTDRRKYVSFGHADFGSNRLVEPSFGQTGHHVMEGVFALAGPFVQRGLRLEGAGILDIAPTVLHLLGLPLPRDLDGHVLTGALDPGFLEAHPIRWAEAGDVAVPPDDG